MIEQSMKSWLATLIFFALSMAQALVGAPQKVDSISYQEAQPLLRALEEGLPDELRVKSPGEQAVIWVQWLSNYSARTRARLVRGDEDSLVNFLLFGTSFTHERRLSAADLKSAAVQSEAASRAQSNPQEILRRRIEDLLRGLARPGTNERLSFLRGLVEERGFKVDDPSDASRLRIYIFEELARVLRESERYAEALKAARRQGDANEEFIQRSTLFQDRGISLDTSALPDFAVEEALKAMKAKGLIKPGSVHKAAVLGPGLDFADKDAGYDFYPLQTLQPFALIDALARLGLASPDQIEVTALDVSPRVIAHLNHARENAARGIPYMLHLARDSRVPWKPEFSAYWNMLGKQIGQDVPFVRIAADIPGLQVRAVRVRPEVVKRVLPVEMNIVTQHLALPALDRFDLIIATNIFVYYGVFEQCLSLANIERMLRPGGFLASNNALLELPVSKIHAVGHETVIYSERPADGDHIVWYRRSADIR